MHQGFHFFYSHHPKPTICEIVKFRALDPLHKFSIFNENRSTYELLEPELNVGVSLCFSLCVLKAYICLVIDAIAYVQLSKH